jgi:preprotein translocase subunit SecF
MVISLVCLLASVVSLMTPPSLVLGIEFTGGSTMTVAFSRPVEQSDLRNLLEANGHPNATIQSLDVDRYFIRTRTLIETDVTGKSEKVQLLELLDLNYGIADGPDFADVSGMVAQETVRNAAIAVGFAVVGILFYITWAFRRIPRSFKYGVCAVVALIHDVVIVIGAFSIFGKLIGAQVDTMFITALLAVIGYSVNDTIVVFDRIRENIQRGVIRDFRGVANFSLSESLGRSLNTSLTVILTLLALLLIGGDTLRDFILVFLVGVTAGTYSSIGVATQLLVAWETRQIGGAPRSGLLRRLGLGRG